MIRCIENPAWIIYIYIRIYVYFQLSFWGHRDGWRVWPLRLNMKYVSFKALGSASEESKKEKIGISHSGSESLDWFKWTVAKAKRRSIHIVHQLAHTFLFFAFDYRAACLPFFDSWYYGTLLHFERLHFVLVCLEKKRNKKSIEFLEMKKKKDVDALPVLLSCFWPL